MGSKDFLIVVEQPLGQSPERFVKEELGFTEHVPVATLDYADLIRQSTHEDLVAVLEYAGRTLIWWHDEAHRLVTGSSTALSTKLSERQPPVDFAALYSWDTSLAYGYAVFKGGRRIRSRYSNDGLMQHDEGELLAEELAAFRPSKEIGESGLPLFEDDGELFEHFQIGGEFVRFDLTRRFINDERACFEALRWSAFGTVAERESYQKRRRRNEVSELLRTFNLQGLAATFGLALEQLRERFAEKLCARMQGMLGGGFDLQTAEEDGKVLLFAYFQVARWPLRANAVGVKLGRELCDGIAPGEQLGLRIGYAPDEDGFWRSVPSVKAPLTRALTLLVERHEDFAVQRTAHEALIDTLVTLGVTEPLES